MKIEHLRYFISVANTKSINHAAKELYISQQQLNNILTSLEEEMQLTLLVRTNKGVSLTEDGAEFVKYAEKILTDYSAMQNHFYVKHSITGEQAQSCHGKCILHIAPFFSIFLNDFIKKFREVAPNIDLICMENNDFITEEQIVSGHLYLLGYDPITYITTDIPPFFNSVPVGEFEAYVYLNRNSALAKNESFSLELCSDVVTTALPFASSVDYNLRNINLVSSSIYQHLDAIVQNNAICILPGILFSKINPIYPDITIRPFNKPIFSSCNIVFAKSYTFTEADEILITFLKTYLRSQQLYARQMFL